MGHIQTRYGYPLKHCVRSQHHLWLLQDFPRLSVLVLHAWGHINKHKRWKNDLSWLRKRQLSLWVYKKPCKCLFLLILQVDLMVYNTQECIQGLGIMLEAVFKHWLRIHSLFNPSRISMTSAFSILIWLCKETCSDKILILLEYSHELTNYNCTHHC